MACAPPLMALPLLAAYDGGTVLSTTTILAELAHDRGSAAQRMRVVGGGSGPARAMKLATSAASTRCTWFY